MSRVPVLATQLTGLLRRPGRMLLTGLSVLIAAFVVYAAVLVNQLVTATMLDTFSGTTPGTSLVIDARDSPPVAAGRLAAIRKVPGVAGAAGRLTTPATVGSGPAGTDIVLVADPGPGPLSPLTVTTGTFPAGATQIALDTKGAQRLHVTVGDTLRLRSPEDRVVPMRVTAIVAGPSSATTQVYAPDSVVRRFAGATGFQQITVLTEPGAELTTVAAALPAAAGRPELAVVTGAQQRAAEAADAIESYLPIIALIASFVSISVVAAALVTTSTFRIVFAQRLKQLALLRTIGAQRAQLVRALLAEGALTGLVAAVLGVLAAQAAVWAVPTIAASYGQHVSPAGAAVGSAVAVVVGAVLMTIGAVLAPAVSASGVAPLQALREAGTSAGEKGVTRARLAVGIILVLATAAMVVLVLATLGDRGQRTYSTSDTLLYLVGAGALAYFSLMVLGPLVIRPLLAVAGWPLRRLGATGRLAVSGVGGAPRRAAAVSVIVALGVALVAGGVVGMASFQAWANQKYAGAAPGDLVLSSAKPLGPGTVDELRADPSFEHVTPFRVADIRNVSATAGNTSFNVVDVDMKTLPALRGLFTTSGSVDDLRPGTVILSAGVAQDRHVTAGDSLTLDDGQGRTLPVVVAAVLMTDVPVGGSYLLSPADFDVIAAEAEVVTGVYADTTGGAPGRDQAIGKLRKIADRTGAEVDVPADLRDYKAAQVTKMFAATLGLFGITVLIAVVGVGTTTGLSVLERFREFGLLRAVGVSRPGLRRMIGLESALYGLIGAVLGLLLGIPLAALALDALDLGFPLVLPAGTLALVVVALALLTAGTGLLPARRAARVSPMAALATVD